MNLRTLEFVRVEVAERIAEITLVWPKALNTMHRRMMSELELALDELRRIESLAYVILTGHGDRAFVAGADLEKRDPNFTGE